MILLDNSYLLLIVIRISWHYFLEILLQTKSLEVIKSLINFRMEKYRIPVQQFPWEWGWEAGAICVPAQSETLYWPGPTAQTNSIQTHMLAFHVSAINCKQPMKICSLSHKELRDTVAIYQLCLNHSDWMCCLYVRCKRVCKNASLLPELSPTRLPRCPVSGPL